MVARSPRAVAATARYSLIVSCIRGRFGAAGLATIHADLQLMVRGLGWMPLPPRSLTGPTARYSLIVKRRPADSSWLRAVILADAWPNRGGKTPTARYSLIVM